MNAPELLPRLFEILQDYLTDSQQRPVVNFKTPEELKKLIPFAIEEEGVTADEFIDLCKQYLQYSVNTGHKQFANQLFSGFNLPAFAGEVISGFNNTSMYTYEVAPVATLVENEMIRLLNSYTGYQQGDGIFLTGGSNANLIAMFSARNRLFPEGRHFGLSSQSELKAFVSEDAHYSFDNAANLIGIGTHNLIKIATDNNGRMIPKKLEEAILQTQKDGNLPFFVGATSGTTVKAAFDPLEEITDICQKYNIWCHADGAFGGSLILSKKNKHFFKGLEKTDSFTWDQHKLMNIPLISSVLLVKKQGSLQFNLADINTSYIYHNNSGIDDLGNKSVQCGRKVDATKLWFAWKYYGKKAYAERMEKLLENAAYAEQCVKKHAKLELQFPRQSLTICFRYRPETSANLNSFNFEVRERLRKSGRTLVNIAYINKDLSIRLILPNAEVEKADIDAFFENFLDVAGSLEAETY